MSETKKGRKAVAGKRAPARAAAVATPKKRAPRAKVEVVEEIFEVEAPAPTTRKTRQSAAPRKTAKVEKVAKPAAARKTSKSTAAAAPAEAPAKPARRTKTAAAAVVAEVPAKATRKAKTAKAAPRAARAKVAAVQKWHSLHQPARASQPARLWWKHRLPPNQRPKQRGNGQKRPKPQRAQRTCPQLKNCALCRNAAAASAMSVWQLKPWQKQKKPHLHASAKPPQRGAPVPQRHKG